MNRFLLHLRDIEYGSDDRFHLATTKNAFDLEKPQGESSVQETVPPVQPDFYNGFKGLPLEEIEAFTLDLNKNSENEGVNSSLFVLLDEQGVQDKTCIVAQRHFNSDDESEEESNEESRELYADHFDKVRVPWAEVYSMWCNLDIANMDFQDFCDEDEAPGAGTGAADATGAPVGWATLWLELRDAAALVEFWTGALVF